MHAKEFEPAAVCPLDDVRVLDLSRLVAGNILTHVLADLGAEVIKVEKPGRGDDLRNWTTAGTALWWQVYGRNKKSLCLDLRQDTGREILLRLVESAEVLVENYRLGTLEKMGLGPEVLHRRNPRLVIVRVSGWGQTGPWRAKPGFGTLIEAFSGFAAMNGFADREPVLPAFAMADAFAGLYGAIAALTALRAAEAPDGRGQVIDLALIEPILAMLGPKAAEHRLTGVTTPRLGSRCTIQAPRDVYRTRDGKYVALSTGTQAMAERLFAAIGRPELNQDPRFRTNAARLANREAIEAVVAAFIHPRQHVLSFRRRSGRPIRRRPAEGD
jgi:formyl-CoA transferase